MYMDIDLIEDQFNETKITPAKFYSLLSNETHSFHDGNGRRSNIMFANDDKISFLMRQKVKNS